MMIPFFFNIKFPLFPQGVKNFVRQKIAMGQFPEQICEELMTYCLAPDCMMGGLGGDNMTVVLICFLHNKPYEELIKRCASSLEQPASGVNSFNDPDRFKPRMPNGDLQLLDSESNPLGGLIDPAEAAAAAASNAPASEVEGQTAEPLSSDAAQKRTLIAENNDDDDDDDDENESENDQK